MSEGGKAIIAMRSSVKNDTISTIVPTLTQGSFVAGWQRLNGEQALDYVRQRNIPGTNGDFGRIQRQQKFLLAVGRNVGSVNNITRIPSFLSALGDNLRTNIPMAEMTRLANALLRWTWKRFARATCQVKAA